jgi:hypothetical protein
MTAAAAVPGLPGWRGHSPQPPVVLSVSAHSAANAEPCEVARSGTPPRRCDRLRRLREIIAAARIESSRLRAALDDAAAHEADAEATMRRLEERLLIGARMLDAFAVQIERIEQSIEAAEALHERQRELAESVARMLEEAAAAR